MTRQIGFYIKDNSNLKANQTYTGNCWGVSVFPSGFIFMSCIQNTRESHWQDSFLFNTRKIRIMFILFNPFVLLGIQMRN